MIKMSIDIGKLPKSLYTKQVTSIIPANVIHQVIEKSSIIIGKEEDDYELPAFEEDKK
jgi:hypothetical protein